MYTRRRKIRVLIVEDSALMRKYLKEIINDTHDLTVIGTASDGEEALIKVKNLKPDIVTLDINLPAMNGLVLLQHILIEAPTPCVMISAYTSKDSSETFKAMELGAIDFVEKPSGEISRDLKVKSKEITTKIRNAISVNLGNVTRQRKLKTIDIQLRKELTSEQPKKIVLIGVSTGGPRTLMEILPNLPANLGCPVIVVQHMPGRYTKSFAERINKYCPMQVKEASNMEIIRNNVIYVAPGDMNLEVFHNTYDDTIKFITHQPSDDLIYYPNINYTLNKVIDLFEEKTISVILTGMGDDGAQATERLFHLGGKTIVESEETAIVYGMPKAVVDRKAAERILPVNKIATAVIGAIKGIERNINTE